MKQVTQELSAVCASFVRESQQITIALFQKTKTGAQGWSGGLQTHLTHTKVRQGMVVARVAV